MALATATIDSPVRHEDGGRRVRAFAAARRHSRIVLALRFVLKWGAVAAVAFGVAAVLYNTFGRPLERVTIGSIGVDGTKVTMGNPKLTGFRKDGNPYLVNAEKAVQDVQHPTIVELSGIDARISTADRGEVRLSARSGVYDTAAEHLDVSDDVNIKSPQYEVRMQSASIDFKAGVYSSDQPVSIVTTTGMKVDADSVSANDNGHELQFEGNVRSLFTPQPADAPAGGPRQ